MTNQEIMAFSRSKLKENWSRAVIVCFLYMVITVGFNALQQIGSLINLIISGPLLVGLSIFFLHFIRDENTEVEQLFKGFSLFLNSFKAYIIALIFIILWTLLLIVPGIIAALSYSMCYFIIADNPKIDGFEAIKRSKTMMEGHKLRLFYLGCRFIGWIILGILTLGIGFLWILPYMITSFAKFYENIKDLKSPSVENTQESRSIEEQVKKVDDFQK
ncbi:MAG: DUF975 family protein [Chitinispirillia bacterium]|jgi:uncharacterized membrane protein